jgi:predicted RNase H-like HicB family nuclease
MHVESGEVSPMQFKIFIQNTAEQHFTASVLGMPMDLVAEGTTEAEALGRAEVMLEEVLATGKIVTIELPPDRTSQALQMVRLPQNWGPGGEIDQPKKNRSLREKKCKI